MCFIGYIVDNKCKEAEIAMNHQSINSTLYKNYNLVWYGVCETECESLNLNDYADKIEFVFQTTNDVGGGTAGLLQW